MRMYQRRSKNRREGGTGEGSRFEVRGFRNVEL
jgi:hypothetical protein